MLEFLPLKKDQEGSQTDHNNSIESAKLKSLNRSFTEYLNGEADHQKKAAIICDKMLEAEDLLLCLLLENKSLKGSGDNWHCKKVCIKV